MGGQGFAGGLAQGIQSGQQIAGQVQGQRQQQQLLDLRAEAQKESQEFKIKEQKIKLQMLQFKRDQERKKEDLQKRFFGALAGSLEGGAGNQALAQSASTGAAPTTGGPFTPAREPQAAQGIVSPLPNQVGQAEEVDRLSSQVPNAFLNEAGPGSVTQIPGGEQSPTIFERVQGLFGGGQEEAPDFRPTPPATAEDKGKLIRLQMLAAQAGQSEVFNEAVRQGLIRTPASVQKGREREQRDNMQRLFLQEAQAGNKDAARASVALQLGQPALAIKLRFPESDKITDNILLNRAVNLDREAIDMLRLKQELTSKRGINIEVGTDSSGRQQTFFSTGGGQKIPQSVLKSQVEELSAIQNAETVLTELDGLLQETPGSIGFVANAGRLVRNLQSQFADVAFEGKKAQDVKDKLFGINEQNISSTDTLAVISSALIVRSVLQEKGQVTDRDQARGERAIGFNSGFFSTASVPDMRTRIKSILKLQKKQTKDIRDRSEVVKSLLPEKQQGTSYLQDLINKLNDKEGTTRRSTANLSRPRVQRQSQNLPNIADMTLEELQAEREAILSGRN